MSKSSEDSEKAKEFIKKNKRLLFEKFANSKIYHPNENPISLFMTSSPGAGKTEYSKAFVESFFNAKENVVKIKSIFKDKVKVYLVIKNYSNNIERFYPKVNCVDKYLKDNYNEKRLYDLLKDEI